MPSQRSRFWCFTLHPKSLDDGKEQTIEHKLPDKARYAVFQREMGAEGKEHYQGYIEFNDAVAGGQRTSWVKEWIPGAHTEIKYAQRDNVRHYCMKPCSADCKEKHCVEARTKGNGRMNWETSKPTEIGRYMGDAQGKRTDVDDIKEAIKKGASFNEVCELNFSFAMKHARSLRDYIVEQQPKRDWKTEVKVIWGDSGTGKSRWCRETYPDAYWLSKSNTGNVWWNGYNGQEVVIIDDFYGWIPFDYYLHLTDRYPMSGETKGGMVNLRPRVIVITSNREPRKWYSSVLKGDKQFQRAFGRRFDSIERWTIDKKGHVSKVLTPWEEHEDDEEEVIDDEEIVIPEPSKRRTLM